ncbi:TonB-dependent receptor plug domain-containing protein [Asticcacaulis endophyticus]|uniref:Ligand-gated channel n=1 Tax=Asticcacaulis endophyticus TaxID=1395890 RepID=A0A918USE1_9CAUL|nr:TonB-dependent receptor [Asticcacaulis endophyticus]GGZ30975.1 ligand-gated channel [Asticcacaulis endophyticus]
MYRARNLFNRRAALICGVGLVALSSSPGFADDVPAADAAEPTTVVVTGSRGKPRTISESPSPIDVIDAAQLSQTGKVTLKEALAVLLPSLNYGTVNGFAHNNVVRPVSMRGLGGGYTLVLVNGKRRHPTTLLMNSNVDTSGATPVDLDQIPVGAIERIEVLRDGAAAQYGSDAIAGVINIILKSGKGGSVSLGAGQTYSGDGENVRAAADWGTVLDNGLKLHLALETKYQGRTDRNDPATGSFYFPINGQPDPREATIPKRGDYNGNPQVRAATFAANFELPVRDGLELYSFVTAGAKSGNAFQTKRRPNANTNIPEIHPDGFIPVYRLKERDYEVVAGGRGLIGDWTWDASTAVAQNLTRSSADTLNPSLGLASPTKFKLYDLVGHTWTTNLDVRRGYEIGLAEPLSVAAGVEYREELYKVKSGDAASYVNGGYVFPSGPLAGRPALIGVQGVNTVDASDAGQADRSNLAAYVDLGLSPTKAWYVGFALRSEHYDDDAGDTVSGKLTTRYAFTNALAVRATVSTGFRAPSLSQQLYGQRRYSTQTIAGVLYQFPSKVVRVDSPLAQALGAQPLTPEKSRNYSLGFTFTPSRRFRTTIDAYRIDIDDRIALTSTLSGPGVNALLAAAGLPTDIYVQYFTNAIDTKTEGLDIVSEYTTGLGRFGNLKLSGAFNWNQTEITNIKANPPELASLGANLVLFDRVQQGTLTVGYPETKAVLGANWRSDRWTVDVRATRYDDVTQVATVATDDRTFGAKWITDLSVSYAFTDKLGLTVGADNLFDEYPDAVGIVSANGGGKYGAFSPFGQTGGYYYTRLDYRF